MHIRPATIDDAPAILDILTAHEVPLIGRANATLEDVVDDLGEPGWNIETDGWLAHAGDGTPIGWAWTSRKGSSGIADISISRRPGHDEVAAVLWDLAERRAQELVDDPTIDVGIFPNDELMRGLAEQRGYDPAATFIRMRIDHAMRVAYPSLPDGVQLCHGTTSEQVRRDFLNVRNESFADHFGFVFKEYDTWVTEREASSAHDWSLLHVAYVDGEPAAGILRTNNFVPDENCGYVLTLGTAPKYQSRGLAGSLLRYAFAADAEQGRMGTILHVDSNPKRPALGLYQRHGMREVLRIDVWRRVFTA
jgi:ribosomal protein S18 acetylase RimI-like enzyme